MASPSAVADLVEQAGQRVVDDGDQVRRRGRVIR